jgi:hypothetical protein
MSEQVWLAVIAAATLVIFGILFRRQFKEGKVKVGQEGIEAGFQTHSPVPPPTPPAESVQSPEAVPPTPNRLIMRNVDIIGQRNWVSAHGNTEVSDVRVLGEDQSLTAGSEDPQKS